MPTRSLRWRAAFLVQPPRANRRSHLLRFFAVDRGILELDHGIEPLPREALKLDALAGTRGTADDCVSNALLGQCLFHAPTRTPPPRRRATMELYRHEFTVPFAPSGFPPLPPGGHSVTLAHVSGWSPPPTAPVDSDQSYRVTRTSARLFSAEKLVITSNAMRRASVGSRASGTSNVNRRGRPEKRTRH